MSDFSTYPDILITLHNAVQRRHESDIAHREKQARRLSSHRYQRLWKRLNKTKFLPLLNANTTRFNIYYIKKKFARLKLIPITAIKIYN